jgi:hypothetical protein
MGSSSSSQKSTKTQKATTFDTYQSSASRQNDEQYHGDKTRDRSVADRQTYPNLEKSAYRAEQKTLYPPDGYHITKGRNNLGNGKRQRVPPKQNRPFPADYEADRQSYKSAQETYECQKGIARSAEAGTTAHHVYEGKAVSAKKQELLDQLARGGKLSKVQTALLVSSEEATREKLGVYYPTSHQQLRESSDAREEHSYK